jgi:hypothetical protein
MKQSSLIRSASTSHSRPLAVPLLGGLASLLLHAVLLTPAFLGMAQRASRPANSQGAAASTVRSSEEATIMLTFIEQTGSAAKSGAAADDVAPLIPAQSALLAPVAMPDLPPPITVAQSDDEVEEQAAANETRVNDTGRAQMFGRYVGQINARIQRAWIRPRTPIAAGPFACRVRIVQDESGGVREIEVKQCNGDIPWQMSLVRAIQSASPLPAPPDPSVFARTLTLDLVTQPFIPGGNPEGFGPETRTAME